MIRVLRIAENSQPLRNCKVIPEPRNFHRGFREWCGWEKLTVEGPVDRVIRGFVRGGGLRKAERDGSVAAMHPSSFDKMAAFVQKYLADRRDEPLLILDLGSQDFNGSYRPLFDQKPWRYLGVDMAAGPNVDIVLREPYRWREIKSGSADVIVSGQTFEHTEFFWLTMREMKHALKPGGLCCIIAPSAGPEHQYPVDCWRVYPDGLRAAARYGGLETLEAWTQWDDLPQYDSESNKWHDSVLVARRPNEKPRRNWRRRLDDWLERASR